MPRTLLRTPPKQKTPSKSESDIQQLVAEETVKLNITQRAKRKCLSGEVSNIQQNASDNDEFANFKKEIKDMIKELLSIHNGRLDKLENHILEIKSHYADIKTVNTELEKSMSFISDKISSLDSKISGLEKERNAMSTKLSMLEQQTEIHNRNLTKTSVEIRNVPKRLGETKSMLYDTIKHFSKQLNIEMEQIHIRDITRQPSKKENLTSNITLEFSNTLLKTNFLSAVKQFNKQNPKSKVNSTHLDITTTRESPIYVTELLTTQAKRLFYLTRAYAKTNEYRFCWTSNGRIMLKKDTDTQTIIINDEQQLKHLPQPSKA
ncbi:unnamed protein product [Diatraea saccharalis]|uniref:FP protein C-terminal domain-containing protein n=1 Tax=Diatraea saccharalis TaxID=40085 RepID=A0A9N9WG29_9NEOP|nr:unnamed protein product [Diatraea saccharalis]